MRRTNLGFNMSTAGDEKRGGYESPLEKSVSETGSNHGEEFDHDWTAEEEKKLV